MAFAMDSAAASAAFVESAGTMPMRGSFQDASSMDCIAFRHGLITPSSSSSYFESSRPQSLLSFSDKDNIIVGADPYSLREWFVVQPVLWPRGQGLVKTDAV